MKKTLITYFFVLISVASYAQSATQLKLWYDKPSGKTWERALPVGNGRLGGMVYGNPDKETIQLNESSVWTGGPDKNNNNPNALTALPEIRKLLFDGKHGAAQALAGRTMLSKNNGMMFQPVGNLNLVFPGHEPYKEYYRELDIEKAVATTWYTVNGVKYTREVFASVPAQAIIVRITASQPGKLNFSASFTTQQKAQTVTTAGDELTLSGITGDHEGVKGQVEFYSAVKIKNEGGNISRTDTSLEVSGATTATIYISIATNFVNYKDVSADEVKRGGDYLTAAYKKEFPQLLEEHTATYQKYFNRVKLDLGTGDISKPTDVRLKAFATGNDPQFAALYFQFGRYLLISSSQPGGQAANLQGIWNDRMSPPWDSKYTININTEMNYWPAEKDNLAEMHEPLIQMVRDLSVRGQETARTMYGARGWMAHHNTDIWRITGPVDGIFWAVWSMGGAWLCQHAWEKYLYSGDKKYLESIYPILKGAAVFFVDDLVEDPANKWLVINPGTSPENAPKAHGGSSFGAGVTMDNQIVYDMLSTAIHAAETLKKDAAFVDTLKSIRKRLPPMHIGQYGQLQEWLDDVDNPEDHHRHISHLYGLFPSNQISAFRTPQLFDAAHTTITQRGDLSTGWSMGWKVNWWARLLDGNHAYKLITNQLTPVGTNAGGGGTYPNLFDAHAPFQIDGNFGCTSGITEMLMQSQEGAVHLLPALPDVWKKEGSVKGLRARGGFEIKELAWQDGKITKLVITSKLGGNCRIRVPNNLKGQGIVLSAATGANTNGFYYTEEIPEPIISEKATINQFVLTPTFEYDFKTTAGKTYTLLIQ